MAVATDCGRFPPVQVVKRKQQLKTIVFLHFFGVFYGMHWRIPLFLGNFSMTGPFFMPGGVAASRRRGAVVNDPHSYQYYSHEKSHKHTMWGPQDS